VLAFGLFLFGTWPTTAAIAVFRLRQEVEVPKYIGKLFHDFRRTVAYESWKSNSSIDDCMKLTGHKTASMFKRYADLFSEEEEPSRQRAVQDKRREWKQAQARSCRAPARSLELSMPLGSI
jgi:integrase